MDEKTVILMNFFTRIESDCRISTAHISVYTSLWRKWKEIQPGHQLVFFSREIMPVCKISSVSTYHKTIRQLREYGYITYEPSFNHFCGSMVDFTNVAQI